MRFTSDIPLTVSNGVSEQQWRERGIDTVALHATFDAADWDAAILTVNGLLDLFKATATEAIITVAPSTPTPPAT